MTILSSDIIGYPRIIVESSFYWRKHSGSFRWNLELQDFVAGAVFGEVGRWLDLLHALEMRSLMTFILRGRRSIRWSWRVALVAPRIGNDVSNVTRINHEIHFAWQAQYLVRLEGDFSWQAQHFVTFWEIAGARNVVFYNRKASPRSDREGPRSGGCEMTILSSDYRRISSDIVESSFYSQKQFRILPWNVDLRISWQAVRLEGDCILPPRIEMRFHMWRSLMTFILRGRRSISWGWRVTLLAPRIGNEVSYLSQIIDDIHFAWQAHYLLRLAGVVTGAALRDILGDSRSAKCCILQYKIVSKMGRVRSPKRRARDDDFILGLSSDYGRIVFLLAEALQGFSAEILSFKILWQAQY